MVGDTSAWAWGWVAIGSLATGTAAVLTAVMAFFARRAAEAGKDAAEAGKKAAEAGNQEALATRRLAEEEREERRLGWAPLVTGNARGGNIYVNNVCRGAALGVLFVDRRNNLRAGSLTSPPSRP